MTEIWTFDGNRFAARHPTGGAGFAGLKRVVSQKCGDSGQVIDAGRGVPFLPIDDGQFVAADPFCDFGLLEAEIEAALADRLANGFWSGRIPFLFGKVRPMQATHPT